MGNCIRFKNFGRGCNCLISNELIDMMVLIYNNEYLNFDVLIEVLVNQKDRLLGYVGLEKLLEVKWLGEKIGENFCVLGIILGFSING